MKEAVIVGAVRTPVGRYMGALKDIQAFDLAASVLNEAIKRSELTPEQVDEVIMGQSYQNGEYVNIARMSLLTAGWPEAIPGITFDRRCCTGLDVACFAAMKIQSGHADVVVAGGVESMSNAEFYVPGDIKWGIGGKKGMPRGHGDLSFWGIPFYDRIQRARVMSQPEKRYGILPSMMSWAETAAKEEGITRAQCDQWVLADLKQMGMEPKDYSRINVNGSGISLGHPIACTGTRLLVTLLYEMQRTNSRYGLECICGGGGLGVAAIIERR